MKLKQFAAVVSAAAVMLALAGCGKEETKPEPGGQMTESRLESLLENDPNFDPFEESKAPEVSEPVSSVPAEETYEMTDEIKNAAFDSGLVQINNDVFQQGGYITVADFVEKYKDKYDIVYKDGTYEERKDYLLEYRDPNSMFVYKLESFGSDHELAELSSAGYLLKLTPKTGSNKNLRSLYALVGNFTSKDKKITLNEGIVIGVNLYGGDATKYIESAPHVWMPQGIGLTGMLNNAISSHYKAPKDLGKANESFTLDEFSEYLEQLGFSKRDRYPSHYRATAEDYDKKYVKPYTNVFNVYCLGEPNLFGLKPVYQYTFKFSSDTDKMSEANVALHAYFE